MQSNHDVDVTASDINSYKAVKYEVQGQLFPSQNWNDGRIYSVTFNNWTTNVVVFYDQKSFDSQSTCISNNGRYTAGSCTYFYIATGICVKTSRQNNHTSWQLDNTYGGIGCWYSNAIEASWSPVQYNKVGYGNGTIYRTIFDFNSMYTTIRHQKDPYVFAQQLTDGTMRFGLTPAEKAAVGLALIIIGGIFCLPCCFFVVALTICFNRRRYGYSNF